MAYYFAIEKEKDNYVAINIKRCIHSFDTNYQYENSFACLLEEINNITTRYPNEQEFKLSLMSIFALPVEHFDKPLAIFYAEGMEKRLIKGKVLYEDSRYLLEDVSEVIKYIETKSKENDYTFFRQLAETLADDSVNKSLISRIASLIEKGVINDTREKELDEINTLGNNMVIESAKLLIYNIHIDDKGLVKSTNKINYEKLHNLVSFINDYEMSLTKTTQHKKTKENTSL